MAVNPIASCVGIEFLRRSRRFWETIIQVLSLGYLGFCRVRLHVLFVETRGLTLEELNIIFQQKNPVKASMKRNPLVVARATGVDIYQR